MNVLILTPDRVGSTLLQRLITVYMQVHKFNQPVINLHELTNGLEKYHSTVFNQQVLGKPHRKPWGYYQTLDEITQLLHSVEHYKTARLAQYHIRGRGDTTAQQVPFYRYLNENFFIISAQRDNLLEHALSWGIYTHSKKLNVFNHQEKINTFQEIYKNLITIPSEVFVNYLNKYRDYLDWVHNHFTVSSYFHYDRDLPRIEQYILDLPIFDGKPYQNWKDIFGLEFSDWNRCHYLLGDLSGKSKQLLGNTQQQLLGHSGTNLQIQSLDHNQIVPALNDADQGFLMQHSENYVKSRRAIDELVGNKILVSPVPIKLQTFLEKKALIKNFDQLIDTYNQWVADTNVGTPYTLDHIHAAMQQELTQWHTTPALTSEQIDPPVLLQQRCHNDVRHGHDLNP